MKRLLILLCLASCDKPKVIDIEYGGETHEYIQHEHGVTHISDCRYCNTDNPEGNPDE